ncbi:FeoB-associated Cys-rich membrane protein [Nonlabens sp.]|nr:FeoB-associated Cys-rich membrane protein [Nonlabens sp.]
MYIAQTIIVILIAVAAVIWLLRKSLFPKKFHSSDCGDGDCGCH